MNQRNRKWLKSGRWYELTVRMTVGEQHNGADENHFACAVFFEEGPAAVHMLIPLEFETR